MSRSNRKGRGTYARGRVVTKGNARVEGGTQFSTQKLGLNGEHPGCCGCHACFKAQEKAKEERKQRIADIRNGKGGKGGKGGSTRLPAVRGARRKKSNSKAQAQNGNSDATSRAKAFLRRRY